MSEAIKPRRSALYMPGSNARAMQKARTLPCDAVILDLEDSVGPDAKPAAREQIVTTLAEGGFGQREVVVRINGFDTPWGEDDLHAIAAAAPDAIQLPKVESAAQVQKVADALDAAGASDTRIWVMPETPRGVLDLDAIAGSHERIAVLMVGAADLSKIMRVSDEGSRTALLPALSHCVLVARAHGLDILDGVFRDLHDAQGFEAYCEQGRELGFDGKSLIHPNQIDTANRVFSPSAEAIAEAHEIVAASDAAGGAVIVLNGRMVEALHAEEARRLVAFDTVIKSQDS